MTRYARRILPELPWGTAEAFLDVWNQLAANEPLSTLGRVIDLDRSDVGLHEILPSVWALRIRAHLAARARGDAGDPIEAIHYDDLVADREHGAAQLLAACGLDEELTPLVLAVFERDAHAGMVGANDTPVRDLDDAELEQVIRQLPQLAVPAYDVERL